MDNILRHDLCIFADAIRAAGAEAKCDSLGWKEVQWEDAIRAADAEAKPENNTGSKAEKGRNPRSGRCINVL